MKSIIRVGVVTVLATVFACNPNRREPDSVKMADEKNKEAFDKTPKEGDAAFVVDAVTAAYSKIGLTQLGLQHSRDSVLQRKLRIMEADNTWILNELLAYADTQKITVPTAASTANNIDAENFDADLCATLREHQEKDVRKFETCMSRTKDMELKNWIATTLPILNDHLKTIKDHRSQDD